MNLKLIFCTVMCCAATALSGCGLLILSNLDPDQRAKLFLVPPDRSVIYVYRDEDLCDVGATLITLDGQQAGETAAKTYLSWTVTPGEHTINLSKDGTQTVALEVEVGKTYFLEQLLECGPPMRAQFQRTNPSAGRTAVRTSMRGRDTIKIN